MAIYGFARLTDDLGDEADGDRLAMLDWLEAELERAAVGEADASQCFGSSRPVIESLDLSLEPFRDLIEANRMDQRVTRYESFGDLVEYCMLSAAPVGRLVLAVFGVSTPERVALSDKVCIALQLVEHLQDIGEDARRGRVYMPAEDMSALRLQRGRPVGEPRVVPPCAASSPWRSRGPATCSAPGRRSRPRCRCARGRRWPASWQGAWPPSTPSTGRATTCSGRCAVPRKTRFASRALSGLVAASAKRGRS